VARLPRLVIADQPQHVIVRGNNRSDIFCAEADYQFYLEKLQLACDKHDCKIHAYILMTNHVHLLLTPHAEDGLSTGAVNVFDYFLVTSHSKVY